MYADDVALMALSEEGLQRRVLEWQEQLQKGGLKMNAEKSEVMVSERDGRMMVKIVDINGKELQQVDEFKYLGTVVAKEGGTMTAVRQRIKATWCKWREITGVMYDRKIPRKLKSKLHKAIIRPVLLYGAECWAVGKKEEELVTRTEMRMLRRIVGVTLMNKERNEKIRKECGVADIKLKMREARLRWFGHVERREEGRGVKRVMQMEVDGSRRRRGKTKEEMD